jgi:hypothetical protein
MNILAEKITNTRDKWIHWLGKMSFVWVYAWAEEGDGTLGKWPWTQCVNTLLLV